MAGIEPVELGLERFASLHAAGGKLLEVQARGLDAGERALQPVEREGETIVGHRHGHSMAVGVGNMAAGAARLTMAPARDNRARAFRSHQASEIGNLAAVERLAALRGARETDMGVKVAINGFGRIGRLVARAVLANPGSGLELVAINDLGDAKANALLFKRDSVHGTYRGSVEADGNDLVVDGKRIKVTAERDPANLPHAADGVDIALECTGFFTDAGSAGKHLTAGAKRVLISAPAKGVDLTVVYGVNHEKLTAEHRIVSNASCTTNCLAPIAKVMNDVIGIERGLMTTVHSYTNDQKILDQIHPDMRRARAAAMSMIPTTTGAARAVGEVMPELKGKLDGSAIRVPTPNVSVVDLTFTPKRDTSVEEVNGALKAAAESGPLKGILQYVTEPLVSIDFNGDSHSSSVDSLETAVLEGKLVRVLSWYDNEWGFSNRMAATAGAIAKLL